MTWRRRAGPREGPTPLAGGGLPDGPVAVSSVTGTAPHHPDHSSDRPGDRRDHVRIPGSAPGDYLPAIPSRALRSNSERLPTVARPDPRDHPAAWRRRTNHLQPARRRARHRHQTRRASTGTSAAVTCCRPSTGSRTETPQPRCGSTATPCPSPKRTPPPPSTGCSRCPPAVAGCLARTQLAPGRFHVAHALDQAVTDPATAIR